jgi:large subunit ribosomal protein L32e
MMRKDQEITKETNPIRRIKRKKPKFVRPESWRYVRVKENWRRPRGLDHKMRLRYRGWPPRVSSGYGGPRATRGLHSSGYREILAHNVEALEGVDPRTQVVRIAHTVGKRKKARILTEARKRKIFVLNIKEALPKKAKLTEETSQQRESETEKMTPSEQEREKSGEAKKEAQQE